VRVAAAVCCVFCCCCRACAAAAAAAVRVRVLLLACMLSHEVGWFELQKFKYMAST
jgi:hypothetical protein